MTSLVLAACAFIGIHLFISGTRVRTYIVRAVGERRFLGLFSLLSVVTFVWLCVAYSDAPVIALWPPADGLRPVALVVILCAAVLVGVGLTTPSPTASGGEGLLDEDDPARGILRITRHPFLWGVTLWAAMHLLLNGDVASSVLFGTMLVLGLTGPPSIDAKRRARLGAKWEHFAAVTSSVPFAAIARGRNTLELGEIGGWRVLVGVGIYLGFLLTHAWLFGVSPFPC
jgi:uncharacterized membrane protein